jgi:hypothetical protein
MSEPSDGGEAASSIELQPIAAARVAAPAAPALPAGALQRLPDVGAGADPCWRLVSAFLVGYPPHSSRAYFSCRRTLRRRWFRTHGRRDTERMYGPR